MLSRASTFPTVPKPWVETKGRPPDMTFGRPYRAKMKAPTSGAPVFATALEAESPGPAFLPARQAVTREVLTQPGVLGADRQESCARRLWRAALLLDSLRA